MLDLCSGRWGWAKAFAARGWECVGVDLIEPPEIPQGCSFMKVDVMQIRYERGYDAFVIPAPAGTRNVFQFDFVCASSPCEDFSTLRNFRPPVPYPERGIEIFNHIRAICEKSGLPYVMENVAGAGRFVGQAVSHCGPYYLWGTGVPALLPQGITKGLTELAMGLREHKGKPGWDDRHGKKGQTPTERVATIPPELARCVVDYAESICHVHS
jgi:hypothetical protein